MPLLTQSRSMFSSNSGRTNTGKKSAIMSDPARNMFVVVFGEFCGTFLFLLLSFFGAQNAIVSNDPQDPSAPLYPASLMFIAASFGTALAVNVWIFYRVSGGMFNPAVTLGLVLVGAVTPLRALAIVPTQLVAAIAAAAVTDGLIPGPLLVANSLGNGASIAQGLFIEMFFTAQLVLTVYFLAVEKHRSTFLAPIGIGISVFIAHIAATRWTGTSINPARSFGPAVVTRFVGYHWIYWLGPVMGALLAWVVYTVFRKLEYRKANPGQDATDEETAAQEAIEAEADAEAELEKRDTVERDLEAQRPASGANDYRKTEGGPAHRNGGLVDEHGHIPTPNNRPLSS